MENTNTNAKNSNAGLIWGIVIGVVIVAVIIFLVVRGKKDVAVTPVTETPDSSVLTSDAVVTEDISAGSVHVATPAASLSYNEALALYKDKRIQFDDGCQVPKSMSRTFKNDTELMLDNRSAETRTLHLGFMGDVTIKPWGFKIVNFSSSQLPRAVVIDCNSLQNVATISLQK